MSATRHHRVTPGGHTGTPAPPRPARRSGPNWTYGQPTVCDSCCRSMTGQEFRGDLCLDCRVAQGLAEVDEDGEEIVGE